DDLHWADETTLLLLQYMVRNLDRDRILLVGTYRDMELERTHPLSETIAALRRGTRFDRVLLRGMHRDEVGELIATASGQPPPDNFIDAVHEVSEGNPFFVAEILRNLVESGAIREEDGRYVGEPEEVLANLPEGVREVVGRRLDRLSDDTNKLLAVGSAMPGGFTLEVTALVAGFDLDRALDLLDEALDALVLTERSDAPGVYEFNHALIRQSLYGELSTPRRVRMHQRIGEALEERFANHVDAHLPELAYHFFQAAPGGNRAKAKDFAVRAGDRALESAAYEEAVRYFDMALQVVDLDDAVDPSERGEVLLRLLDAGFLAGSSEADVIEQTLTEVLDCARRADDTDLFTRVVLKVGFRRYGGSYHRDDYFELILLEALDRVDEGDHFTRAEIFSALVRQLFIHDVDTAAGFAQKAMSEAGASGDPGAQTRAMHAATVTMLPGTEEVEYRERLLALAEKADDIEMQFTAATSLHMSCLHAGRRQEMDAAIEKLRVAVVRLRSLRFEAGLGSIEAMVMAIDGRFADAEAQLLATLDLGRRMDSELAIANTGIGLYQVYRELGRLGELLSATRRAAGGADALASWRAGLISLLTEVGSTDEAAALLADFDLTTIPDDVVRLYTLCALAESAARVRDTAMATRLRSLLDEHGGTHVSIAGIAYWGATDRYIGLLDHALGEFDAAVDRHRRALAQHEAFRAPSWVARSQLDLARSLIDGGAEGDRLEARRLLDASLSAAQSLGAARLVEEALTEKLAMQGLAGSDPGTSIDLVAAAVEADRNNLTEAASADGRVTVAFSDIEGYTALTERVGDERSQEILHAHNDVIRGALAAHGGNEVKSQGDGFMVVFDRPGDAIRWAVDVHQQMATRAFGDDVDALRVRIGMHEGAVITENEDFYGRTVILAARVGARAAGGTTLVTDHLRSLLDDDVNSFGPPLDVELKGLSGTHRLHPVTDCRW
ncbi:MAG: hypothetical protein KDB35_23815, partial [Acidimicrobiales bacterium]|nr:hypothetical protein [Acidimicrobiales bacterium]